MADNNIISLGKENTNAVEIQKPDVVNLSKEEKQLTKLDILKKLSPGAGLREGLNDIVNSNKGALIVINNSITANLFEGGFKVNCRFTSKRLAELAKMDGAIVLSEDFRKILYANTLLVPDRSISTIETGTRHQAAERTAKQSGALIIAVSERKGTINIYYGNLRFILQKTEELLRRATETLQILEKQREIFDELLVNLNVLEVTNLVSIADVCTILQRVEMIRKMANIINEYIVELGREGVIVRMRMREVFQGIEKIQEFILKDYIPKYKKSKQLLYDISFDKLLDVENISKLLFKRVLEDKIDPKGYRILSKTELNEEEIQNLINEFGNLNGIFESDEENLKKILKNKTEDFKKDLNALREQIMVGKKI